MCIRDRDRDIRGAEQDYKKLEKELDKKIKRTPTNHPGYNEYPVSYTHLRARGPAAIHFGRKANVFCSLP